MRAECRLVMPFFVSPAAGRVLLMFLIWIGRGLIIRAKPKALLLQENPVLRCEKPIITDLVSPQDKSLPLPRHDCMGQSGVEPDVRHDQVTNNTCGAILRQLVCTLYVPAPQPSASPNTQWNKCVVNLCMIVRIHM